MSKPDILKGVAERPSFQVEQVKRVKVRNLLLRFLAGALTSVVAGGVTLAFGSRTGGILFGFPAILAASLTLIEEEDGGKRAREDARGAVLGAVGMTGFAVVAAVTLSALASVLALLLAAVAWTTIALGGYRLLWWR